MNPALFGGDSRVPFRIAPRFWAGQFCGMRVEGLPPIPGGSSDSTLVLSWMYDRYSPEYRATIRQKWKTG